MARTNHLTNGNGNLYIDPPSIHPNSRYDQMESCSTLDTDGTGEESDSENEKISSESTEAHTCTSLDDDNTVCKTCTVSESSYQPHSVQYIQHVPSLRKSHSDCQDDLQVNLSSSLDYADTALVGVREGDSSYSNINDRLHFWEQNSLPLLSLSDPLCADLADTNPIQLDKPYISSESGYIQSHDANCSTAQSLFAEEQDTTPDLDASNQGQTITQLGQMPLFERSPLESPTILLDNESMKSMESSLNCYDIGEHTQIDISEDKEVDDIAYESDTTNDEEHHEHEQHNMSSKSGLMPYPLDFDLDFIPVASGPVRPTSIDIRLASDYTPSDLSSGYITTSCMSHDDGQNNTSMMEFLFQQKLKDVNELNCNSS
jgi:hypothetical protein